MTQDTKAQWLVYNWRISRWVIYLTKTLKTWDTFFGTPGKIGNEIKPSKKNEGKEDYDYATVVGKGSLEAVIDVVSEVFPIQRIGQIWYGGSAWHKMQVDY